MKEWKRLTYCPECKEKAFVNHEDYPHCEMCGYTE